MLTAIAIAPVTVEQAMSDPVDEGMTKEEFSSLLHSALTDMSEASDGAMTVDEHMRVLVDGRNFQVFVIDLDNQGQDVEDDDCDDAFNDE